MAASDFESVETTLNHSRRGSQLLATVLETQSERTASIDSQNQIQNQRTRQHLIPGLSSIDLPMSQNSTLHQSKETAFLVQCLHHDPVLITRQLFLQVTGVDMAPRCSAG